MSTSQPNANRTASPSRGAAELTRGATVRGLSKLVFFIYSPFLVFSLFAPSGVRGEEIGQIGLLALATMLSMGVLALLLARLMDLAPPETGSLQLVAMFGNVESYRLPPNVLAFGQAALDRAAVFLRFHCTG